MRQKIKEFLWGGRSFKKEFKKEMRYLILFTLGFTIAFTWRQTIFDISLSIMKFITHLDSSFGLSLLSSILITFISLILIYFTSKWLKDKGDY